MTKTVVLFATALAGLGLSSALPGHHSGSMYQTSPIWIEGTVVSFEPTNPHTITTLEVPRNDGRTQRWLVEGPPIVRLNRAAEAMYLPQPGDLIRFCAFPYKPTEELQRIFPEADFSRRQHIRETDDAVTQAVTGHVMQTPGGEKQFWEPHGVLAECIRSSEGARQSWIDFIDRQARNAWCEQKRYAIVRQDPTLESFIEEVNALLSEPCV